MKMIVIFVLLLLLCVILSMGAGAVKYGIAKRAKAQKLPLLVSSVSKQEFVRQLAK